MNGPEVITGLVVDDDEYNQDMLSRRLQRAGYQVAVAFENGALAMAMVADHEFDLILLDVMMHGVSGLEVLELLLEIPTPPLDLPVIMATAKTQSTDVVDALRLGRHSRLS